MTEVSKVGFDQKAAQDYVNTKSKNIVEQHQRPKPSGIMEDGSRLGKDAFLKLLVAQLQNQDPSNPMDDREFITQMAQFSSLEQMQNMTKVMESLLMSQQQSQLMGYTSFIGKEVKWHNITEQVDENNKPIIEDGVGVIQSLRFKDGDVIFTLEDGREINPGNISGILNDKGSAGSGSSLVQASNLIGKKVTYKETDEEGNEIEKTAKVISVSNKDGKISFILDNDKKISSDQFTAISE